MVEIHICLRGSLAIHFPRQSKPLQVLGPSLLLLHQPAGFDAIEILNGGSRVTGVSLYCRPAYLERLMRHNGIGERGLLEGVQQAAGNVWCRQLPLSCGLNYAAASLLQNPYRNGVRMLHAEAKALEILCEVLSRSAAEQNCKSAPASATESRQLDRARHILRTTYSPVPSIADVARAVGMSPSKLKREFHARFGQTVFECGLEARMGRAFELLRGQQMTICQVAYAVGYQHQTSFTAAFRRHFGVAPRDSCRDEAAKVRIAWASPKAGAARPRGPHRPGSSRHSARYGTQPRSPWVQ